MRVIAIHGLKGTGKDTVGKHLAAQYGYTSVAMAAKLKTFLELMNPLVYGINGTPQRLNHLLRFRCTGWDEAKRRHVGVRSLLKSAGESMKYIFGEDIWVSELLRSIELYNQQQWPHVERLVITDLRFPVELKKLREAFGEDLMTVKILRAGHLPDGHSSEAGLPNELFDFILANDSTLDDLYDAVDLMMEMIPCQ